MIVEVTDYYGVLYLIDTDKIVYLEDDGSNCSITLVTNERITITQSQYLTLKSVMEGEKEC